MSDNDCVSRAWLLAEYDRQHEGPAGKARKLIEDAPAAPQEMSAVEFFEEFQRMCHTVDGCSDCPIMGMEKYEGFPCRYRAYQDADKTVAVVEAWAREHPEERSEQ